MRWKTVPEYQLSVFARVRAGELSQRKAANLLGADKSFVAYWSNPVDRDRRLAYTRGRWSEGAYRKYKRDWARHRYNSDPDYRQQQNKRSMEHYWAMSGFKYNKRLLRQRRQKALKRMAERNEVANGS